ncbi:1,4-alpha-glucan branching enzyme [Runella defluvii]|uniref:1,4-alpha-glucan branching enzyme n=1 Tax=Runella defluvii TaxID=370973 RepID=A0A7W5ZQ05_9BACT|nr:alpha-amylase family glycosyl hydrolase [Runella defluvii]MBB3839921.1 1,4-alpha-glucan branching enzyme [Runella defluvii]
MKTIEISDIQASTIAGMGAVPHSEGVSFRVWAPNAKAVSVVGDFNSWNKEATPLSHEENGYWSVNVPDATIGQEYKYVLFTEVTELMRNDPYARQLTNSVGNSIVHDPHFDWANDDSFQMPNWNEMVIYELHIGTFNVKGEGQIGDFYSAIERLDYLKALGINAVEIMPIAEFPGGYSWGYNPAHPFAVESEYGGPLGLKSFVKAAHEKGIAVILDVVYNHFGPTDMDLWQFDGWSENNLGGIYFYNDWRATTPWGDTRPDYGRPEVRQYIRDNALMWLEEYRLDGLRMDMIPYMRNVNADGNPDNDLAEGYSLIQWINSEIREKFPHKFTVAEDLHTLSSITDSVSNGGLGYSSQWDAQFVHPVREAIIAMHDADRNMDAIAHAITHKYNNDAFQRVIYTESHDEVANGKARVVQEIAGEGDVDNWYAKKRSILGAVLTLTSPGIPMLFQGQALLEDKWFDDTDPIDWNRLSAHKGIAKLYRDLIHLRLNKHQTTAGLSGQHAMVLHLDHELKIIVFYRFRNGGYNDNTLVIINFSQEPAHDFGIRFPQRGHWRLRFNSDWDGYDADFDNHFTSDFISVGVEDPKHLLVQVPLGAYAALIYSLEE